MNTDTDSWGADEAAGANFGDRRLGHRLAKLLNTLGSKPNESIPSALGGWSEITAAYRFFDNDRVTAPEIFAGHHTATLRRMQGQPVILGIQDTTFVNYDGQRAIRDLGRHNDDLEHGYFIHPVLAVTPEGVCLGVLNAETWARGPKEAIKPKKKPRPIEVKESMRWLRGYDALNSVSSSVAQARLICVGDRESDIYDLFAHAQGCHSDWLVRATQDRSTTNGQRIRDVVAEQPRAAQTSLASAIFAGLTLVGQPLGIDTAALSGSFLLNRLMPGHAAPRTTHHHASPHAADRVGLRGRFFDAHRRQPWGDPDTEEVAQGAEIMAKRQMDIGVT